MPNDGDRSDMAWPLHAWLLLFRPDVIAQRLADIASSGVVEQTPNVWQIELGVLRMWHRMRYRPESVGMAANHPVRRGWRAAVLAPRPLRLPFLLAAGSVRPWDLSGLLTGPAGLRRHLLGTHHDGLQFVYDLQMLAVYPGELEQLAAEARAVVDGSHPEADWLRDLCVYEQYHESLSRVVDKALAQQAEGDRHFGLSASEQTNPDLNFHAMLAWCAAQPDTPEATWRAIRSGSFLLGREGFGLRDAPGAHASMAAAVAGAMA